MDADIAGSYERAYAHIKEQILSLAYKPGAPVRAQLIADAVKVSRTPVREALSKLEKEGLVVRDGGWGYVVKPITLKEAMDIYKVREALEVEAVREVISEVNREFITELRGYLRSAEAMIKKGRFDGFRDNARRFYHAIAERTGNAYLKFMIVLIDDQIRLLGAMMASRHMDRPKESLAESRAVLRALEARDAAAAELAVRRHLASARETLMKYVMSHTQDVSL